MSPISRQSDAGSTTLIALCFTAVVAVALASYLGLYQRSYDLSTRELHLNQARHLAQNGLEEALWALNQDTWTSSGQDGTSNWATVGGNRTVTLSYGDLGGGATGSIDLTITNYAAAGPASTNWPSITSVATVTLSGGRTFKRTLAATTAPLPLFGNAIASARSYVRFDQGGTVDSWNSDSNNDGNYDSAYSFTATNPDNYCAVIAATDTNNNYDGTNAVGINQANVYGYLATAGKNVTYSSSGTPPGYVRGPGTTGVNIDPTRLGRSAFIPAGDEFAISTPPESGPYYGGVLYTVLNLVSALLGAPQDNEVYKYDGDLVINAPVLSNLTINRPLKLIVAGNLTIYNSSLLTHGNITINAGGSLQIFVQGSVSIGGDGIINNTLDPRKCVIFAMGDATKTVTYASATAFRGVIYSPDSPIDLSVDGPYYGALLSGSHVHFTSASPIFHYDKALRSVRFNHAGTPYAVTTVTES